MFIIAIISMTHLENCDTLIVKLSAAKDFKKSIMNKMEKIHTIEEIRSSPEYQNASENYTQLLKEVLSLIWKLKMGIYP